MTISSFVLVILLVELEPYSRFFSVRFGEDRSRYLFIQKAEITRYIIWCRVHLHNTVPSKVENKTKLPENIKKI